jgi:hypothetical protein
MSSMFQISDFQTGFCGTLGFCEGISGVLWNND